MYFLKGLGLGILALLAAVPASAGTTAFVGATVIDGTGATPVRDGVVVVTDGRIVAVGPRSTVAIPADAERVDLAGKTVMPGIVNAHAHVNASPRSAVPARQQLVDQLALYARYGVTTVYSLGDDGAESVALSRETREQSRAGTLDHARLFVSGPVLNATDPADGRKRVTENVARGVDIIKVRLEGPPDAPIRQPAVYGAMIDRTHAEGKRIAIHMFTAAETKGVVDAGVDILAHSIRDRDADAALIAALKARGVGYIPTLTRDLSVFVYEGTPDFVADPFFAKEAAYRAPLAALSTPEAQAKMRADPAAQAIKPALAQAKRNLKLLSDAGVPIAMGTDSGAGAGRFQGYFEHLEMAMMAEAGMTPMQVLVAATGGAAQVMRIDDQLGTLRPGRRADLLVLGASPLDNIRHSKTLEQVWIDGRRVH